jgi:hypothetical protein
MRPTRPDRLNNPIRQLRFILAPMASPLSQAELARITDVPLDSLKGVECGRQGGHRELSPRIENRIRCETGAAWNYDDKCWRFWRKDGPAYTREHYLKYRALIEAHSDAAVPLDTYLAALRIKLLMETLPAKDRFKFHFRLNLFLEENRKEFCAGRFAELFEDVSNYIEAIPEMDRNHPLVIARRYPVIFGTKTLERVRQFVRGLTLSDYDLKLPARAKKKQAA